MSGARDLSVLLASLRPALAEGEFVFCSFPGARYGDHAHLEPEALVSEAEGLTLVVSRASAAAFNLEYDMVFRKVSLGVHSSLEAVGLTAAVATALAERGISANIVAGFYHDHIFVPSDAAGRAMDVLATLGG